NALSQRGGGRQGIALRSAHTDFKLRLIVYRQKALADKPEERRNAEDYQEREQHNCPAMGHRPLEHPGVCPIDRPVEARLFRLGLVVFVLEFSQRCPLVLFRSVRYGWWLAGRASGFIFLALDQTR